MVHHLHPHCLPLILFESSDKRLFCAELSGVVSEARLVVIRWFFGVTDVDESGVASLKSSRRWGWMFGRVIRGRGREPVSAMVEVDEALIPNRYNPKIYELSAMI